MLRRTTSAVFNEKTIHRCILLLIHHSQWFAVTPLPEGEFEVEVNIENQPLLARITKDCNSPPSEGGKKADGR